MVPAHSVQIQIRSQVQSVILCLLVWATLSPSFAHLILLLLFSLGLCLFSRLLRLSLHRYNPLAVIFSRYHQVEVFEQDVVVPLRFVEDLGHLGVQVIIDGKHLPHAQHHPDALQLHLKQLRVDPFIEQQVHREVSLDCRFRI